MDALDITGNTVINAHLRERLGLQGYMTWFDGKVKQIYSALLYFPERSIEPDLPSLEMTMRIIQGALRRYTNG